MKKTLVLLPLLAAAVLATSCTTTKKKKRKSSSEEPVPTSVVPGPSGTSAAPTTGKTTTAPTTVPTTTPTSTPTSAPTTATTVVPPGPTESSFSLTPGSHTVQIDFINNYSSYKGDFPYVEATTGVYSFTFAGLESNGCGCFVGSYSGAGYLMMKNKDDYASTSGLAFIANSQSLGNITSISIAGTASASSKAQINVYIGNSPVSTQGGSSAGQTITPTASAQTITGSGSYFCLTASNESVNSQIGVLTISYTI